jgi:hypothetical protein
VITVEQAESARSVITAGAGRARISTHTSVQHSTVAWRTAEYLARRWPAELLIEEQGEARYLVRRYQRRPRGSRPDQVINMTGETRWVQLVTPGGIVNVHTGLVTAKEGLPAVTTEIAPSTREMPTSGDGGHWGIEVRDFYLDRTEVSMIRKGDI